MKQCLAPLVLFALSIFQDTPAQTLKYDFDQYTQLEGLSHNQIFAIAQDKRGFIWLGTEDGLNRFDGYSFNIYKYHTSDTHSLSSNEVRTLYADEDGSLWIGTNKGVCRYTPETESFERFEINYSDSTKLHGNYVTSITRNKDGSLWITYLGSGVDIIYPDRNHVQHYTMYRTDDCILRNDLLTCLQFMPDGNTLLGGREGLQVIGADGKVLTPEQIATTYPWSTRVPDNYNHLLLDGTSLWIAIDGHGLFRVNLSTNEIRNYRVGNSALETNSIVTVTKDSQNRLWFCGDALYTLSNGSDEIQLFNRKSMYSKVATNVVFEDKGNNLWIGTTRAGVRKIDNDISGIEHYHSNQGPGSIANNEILTIAEDNSGTLWIGSVGIGLYEAKPDEHGQLVFKESSINSQLISKSIRAAFKGENNTLWLGSWEGGLTKLDTRTKKLTRYHPRLGNFGSVHVWDIEPAPNGKLWLGTLHDGLCLFSPDNGDTRYFKHDGNDASSLVNNDILTLLIDSRQWLWIGTANGLSILKPANSSFTNLFSVDSPEGRPFTSNTILSMYEDTQGYLWLGTKGAGIIILNPGDSIPEIKAHITSENGLPSDIIATLAPGEKEYVWVATNNGLVKVSLNDYKVQKLNPNMSLPGVEFNSEACYRFRDYGLLLGSTSGLYWVNTGNNAINERIPPVFIDKLKLLNTYVTPSSHPEVLRQPVYASKEISIPPQYNYYTFEFVGINFTNSEKNQYAYKLDNFDAEWNHIGTQRSVTFTNLDPGTYTLRVRASNDDNVWNEEGASLTIHILPPWYSTWWFKLLLTISTLSVIVAFVWLRTLSIRKTNERLEQQVRERTTELTERNKELTQSREEIAKQNSELLEKQEEISAQRDLVSYQNTQILNKNQELETSHERLQDQNEKLEILHREKDGMINIIAHDLKSPLKQIQGLVQLMKLSGPLNEEQEKLIELMHRSVQQGSDLINDLLELHGIKSMTSEHQQETVELTAFIHEWLEQYQSVLKQKSQTIRLELVDGVPAITTIRSHLSRVLDNLLTNAMKFSDSGAMIQLRMGTCHGGVCISIKDNGPGLSEEDMKHLFVPFKKLSARPTGGETSSGLGLSIVKLLLDKIGGTIEVTTKPGAGSEFMIILPVN